MDEIPEPAYTVIYIKGRFFESPFFCNRCESDHYGEYCWPFYEEFIHPDYDGNEGGYVSVCDSCYAWLLANESKLWKRGNKSAKLYERTSSDGKEAQ